MIPKASIGREEPLQYFRVFSYQKENETIHINDEKKQQKIESQTIASIIKAIFRQHYFLATTKMKFCSSPDYLAK